MIDTILLVAAFILFLIAALGLDIRINPIAAGLACWVLSALI